MLETLQVQTMSRIDLLCQGASMVVADRLAVLKGQIFSRLQILEAGRSFQSSPAGRALLEERTVPPVASEGYSQPHQTLSSCQGSAAVPGDEAQAATAASLEPLRLGIHI